MTLDEAIKHCEENACDNNECSQEHKQLAEWLKELKQLKEETPHLLTMVENQQKEINWLYGQLNKIAWIIEKSREESKKMKF